MNKYRVGILSDHQDRFLELLETFESETTLIRDGRVRIRLYFHLLLSSEEVALIKLAIPDVTIEDYSTFWARCHGQTNSSGPH